MDNVRDVKLGESRSTLRAVILHRPGAHPVWHSYLVSLVHLRQLPDMPPPNLAHADSTHEIMILALDPESQADPDVPTTIRYLEPPNLVHQLRGRTDAAAHDLFGAFVTALSSGELNPDTDHRQCQLDWIGRAS